MAKTTSPGNAGANAEKSAGKSEWIDVSVPLIDGLRQGPMEPLTPRIEFILARSKGNPVDMLQLNINSHNGTHIDAPKHHVQGGSSIDVMPLETGIGPARVIEIKDPETIKVDELKPYNIEAGERLLFKTRNSYRPERFTEFIKNWVYFSTEAIHYLIERQVRLLGIDCISIGGKPNVNEIHEALLTRGIYILEDLELGQVQPGRYEMICLPLRLKGGDASPVRAIIKPS
jgi:arylformamidase